MIAREVTRIELSPEGKRGSNLCHFDKLCGFSDFDSGFSLDLDAWHDEEDTSFDLMIQYGDEDIYRQIVTGFTKNGSSFFSEPTGVSTGKHGLFGIGVSDGIFGTYCSNVDKCLDYGHDYFNFSTTGDIPKFSSVTCGYYATQDGIYTYWKDCEEGDNVQKMRYWIRY